MWLSLEFKSAGQDPQASGDLYGAVFVGIWETELDCELDLVVNKKFYQLQNTRIMGKDKLPSQPHSNPYLFFIKYKDNSLRVYQELGTREKMFFLLNKTLGGGCLHM